MKPFMAFEYAPSVVYTIITIYIVTDTFERDRIGKCIAYICFK